MPRNLCARNCRRALRAFFFFNRVYCSMPSAKPFGNFTRTPVFMVKVRKSDNFRQYFDTLVNRVQLLTLKFSTHGKPCERDFLYSLSKSPMLTKLKFSPS